MFHTIMFIFLAAASSVNLAFFAWENNPVNLGVGIFTAFVALFMCAIVVINER